MKYVKRIIYTLLIFIVLAVSTLFITVTFYKKELVSVITDHLKTNFGCTLTVKDIDVSLFSTFPNAAVELKNVYLASDLNETKDQPLLQAESIYLALDFIKLFKKEFVIRSVSLKGAQVTLIKNEDGTKNFEFKKPGTSPVKKTAAVNFEIESINIKNTQFRFLNYERKQNIDVRLINNKINLTRYADGLKFGLKGDVLVAGLTFKPEKDPFAQNVFASLNVVASYCFPRKELFVEYPSFITVDDHPYNVYTYLCLQEEHKKLILQFDSKNIEFKKAVKFLNPKMQRSLSQFKVQRPLDASILIATTPGHKQDAMIISRITSSNNDITIGHSKIPYSNVSFKGLILSIDSTHTKGNADEARVMIRSIKGNVHDVPFMANVLIKNFTHPVIAIDAGLTIDAKKIKFKPGQNVALAGTCKAKITYSGPTQHLNKKEFLNDEMKLRASLYFKNLNYRMPGKPYEYIINGHASLNNKELIFDNLVVKTNGGNVQLKGKVDGFAQYALGLNDGFKAYLNASTNEFNLTPYITKKKTTQATKTAKLEKIEKKIKKAEESNFEFHLTLTAKKFLARKVEADNAVIDLSYKNKLLDIRSIHLNTCGGKLMVKGTIHELSKINVDIDAEKIDISRLLQQFENFGQKAIESKHIKGTVTLKAKFRTLLDDNMEVRAETMDGVVKLKLQNGHLLDYEPLQNISAFIFRNRDFKDISFTEINETFSINGYAMRIQELEIGSNVLNLFVNGVYNFKHESNINLLVPWSNLKKRGKDYVPKNIGESASDVKGLKLNYSGYPKKMKLTLGHKLIE